MQDATSLVHKVLSTDEELITLLGGKVPAKKWQRIYNSPVAPIANEFPRVTMFEVVNDDAEPADDEPQYSDVNIRVDVWIKDIRNLFSICKRIKQVLKSNFSMCIVRLESTMYEREETGETIYHKPINVYLLLEQGE
ncbi:hypothetical protein V6C42_12990 [Pseudoclostridium thermosuccinogenes]|uniref:hypothetical protein n=1 Tax=Clostridium thermosuccinogenes TaxID=84032 RepID=UPI002FD8B819